MANRIISPQEVRDIFDLDRDTGVLYWRRKLADKVVIGSQAGALNGMGYRQVRVFGRIYLSHRLVWAHVTGEWPTCGLDHINRVRSDNRPANLRPASQCANMQNTGTPSDNTSGHKGVRWHAKAKKWAAEIQADRKRHYLGLFPDLEDAVAARRNAELQYHTHRPIS